MLRLLLAACCLSLISCATMTTGTRENIVINSDPAGAEASLVCNGTPAGSGVTPTTITIRRNAGDCALTLSKDGFETLTVPIEQGVNPAYWTNMVFSPLAPAGAYVLWLGNPEEKAIGVGILVTAAVVFGTDFWTGAVHAHKPDRIDAVLKRK